MHFVQWLTFHGGKHHFDFAQIGLGYHFIVPRDLIQLPRDILTRFELNNLSKLIPLYRWQLHKTAENRMARDGAPCFLPFDSQLGGQFMQRRLQLRQAADVHRRIAIQFHNFISLQDQVPSRRLAEKCSADTLGAKTDDCNAVWVCHAGKGVNL